MKLGDDDADLGLLRASGLAVTNCVPAVPSILPNAVIEGPEDVEERIASMCASLHRLAAFEPDCVLCLTGPAGGRDESRPGGSSSTASATSLPPQTAPASALASSRSTRRSATG